MNFKHSIDLDHIDEAMLQSYRSLRTRIGILAIVFPLILVAVGKFWDIDIQPTLSDYYFAADATRVDHTPVRLWFCGILFVVGFFLARYPGFTKHEEKWLNAAGVLAIGVAVFPMSFDSQDPYGFVTAWFGLTKLSLHYICAVLAFVCIAVVIVWYADSTLSELEKSNPQLFARYTWAYRGIALYMAVSIAISFILKNWPPVTTGEASGIWAFAFDWFKKEGVLLAEVSGIWAFAAYWFVKNSEMTTVSRTLRDRGKPLPPRTATDFTDKL